MLNVNQAFSEWKDVILISALFEFQYVFSGRLVVVFLYRNEGTSPEHAQEFTNMEFYWSYADYEDGMELVRKLYIRLAQEVFGKTNFTYRDHTFDLADE